MQFPRENSKLITNIQPKILLWTIILASTFTACEQSVVSTNTSAVNLTTKTLQVPTLQFNLSIYWTNEINKSLLVTNGSDLLVSQNEGTPDCALETSTKAEEFGDHSESKIPPEQSTSVSCQGICKKFSTKEQDLDVIVLKDQVPCKNSMGNISKTEGIDNGLDIKSIPETRSLVKCQGRCEDISTTKEPDLDLIDLEDQVPSENPMTIRLKTEEPTKASESVTSPEASKSVSCQGRCGDRKSFPCSCTDICIVNGNCCHDMKEVCSSVFDSGTSRFKHHSGVRVKCSGITSTFMVVSCPANENTEADKLHEVLSSPKDNEGEISKPINASDANEVFEKIQLASNTNFPNEFLSLVLDAPVTDPTTGLVFKNQTIAECNGVLESNRLLWTVEVKIISLSSPKDVDDFNEIISAENVNYKPSSLLIRFPNYNGSECIPSSKRQCKQEWLTSRPNQESMCLGGDTTYHRTTFPMKVEFFDNIHCLLCNVGSTSFYKAVTDLSKLDKNFKLSLVASLTSAETLKVEAASGKEMMTWGVMTCSVGFGTCSLSSCEKQFTKRPDGVCRAPQEIAVAISGADCAFVRSEEMERKFESMVKCYLETFQNSEIDSKSVRFDTVYDSRLNRSLVQLSALVYFPLISWNAHMHQILNELWLLVLDANFSCEPQTQSNHCSSNSCLFGETEISIMKSIDLSQSVMALVSKDVKGWEPASNNSVILCGMITKNVKIHLRLCLEKSINTSQLTFIERAKNELCLEEHVGHKTQVADQRCSYNVAKKIEIKEIWLYFAIFMRAFLKWKIRIQRH